VKQLLLGAGNSRVKQLRAGTDLWSDLVTVDIDPDSEADIIHDLNVLPYVFAEDGEFDEIHAYQIMEHLGTQGDWRFFFAQFAELHRMLCDGGHLFIAVPSMTSPWLWGDPGHTRALPLEAFSFLCQAHYEQVGKTSSTDYRHVWSGNLPVVWSQDEGGVLSVILKKVAT
jgi:hypothetical protein